MTSARFSSARCALPLDRWRLSARVWILALLPFLLWGVMGSAIHAHRADGSEISWWNVGSIQQLSEQSSTRSHQALLKDEHTHLSSENALCLSCHWRSFSSLQVTSKTHDVFFHEFAATAFSSPRVAVLAAPSNRDNRGPPFLV